MCGGPLKCGGPCSAEHVRTLVNPALSRVEYRGYATRRQLSEDLRRRCAAVEIQSHVRGYLQRVQYRQQLAQHRRQMALLTSGTYLSKFSFLDVTLQLALADSKQWYRSVVK